jgi:hypothetical protein
MQRNPFPPIPGARIRTIVWRSDVASQHVDAGNLRLEISGLRLCTN